MRNVVLYQLLTIDGVAEEPGDWLVDGGPELFANLASIIESQDDVLLGRGTYDYWATYWPTSDVEPFARFINSTPKHVATSTELSLPWKNSTAIAEPLGDYVRDLKGRSGNDIGIHGSIRLARSLLSARLVDELRLAVAPVIAGRGQQLLKADGEGALQRFELADVARSERGMVFLHYRLIAST
jgi:dihydrofolate reductase